MRGEWKNKTNHNIPIGTQYENWKVVEQVSFGGLESENLYKLQCQCEFKTEKIRSDITASKSCKQCCAKQAKAKFAAIRQKKIAAKIATSRQKRITVESEINLWIVLRVHKMGHEITFSCECSIVFETQTHLQAHEHFQKKPWYKQRDLSLFTVDE